MPRRRRHREAAGRRHGVAPGGRGRARRRQAGHARPGTMARASNSAAPSRSTTSTCSPSRTRSTNKGAAPVTLYPYALISRHGTPKTARLLHPARGPDRRARRPGPEGRDLQEHRGQEGRSPSRRPMAGSASPTSTGRRRCCPTPTRSLQARFSAGAGRHAQDLPDRLSARRADASRRARPARPTARLFAGAKEVATVDGYDKALDAQPLRAADRLGLVLFHHQADVQGDRLLLSRWSAISASRS